MSDGLFTGIVQIGIVVADAEAAARKYRELLGIASWSINQVDTERGVGTGFRVLGKDSPTKAKIAWATVNGVEIELIEPRDDTSVYAEFLRSRGPGVHHIMLGTEDFEGASAHLEDGGLALIAEGELQQSRFQLFDGSAELGVVVEIAEGEVLQADYSL